VVAAADKIGTFSPFSLVFHEYHLRDDGFWTIILGPDYSEDRYAVYVKADTCWVSNVFGPLLYPQNLVHWHDLPPEVTGAALPALMDYLQPDAPKSYEAHEVYLMDDGIWIIIMWPPHNQDIRYAVYIDAATYEVTDLIPMTTPTPAIHPLISFEFPPGVPSDVINTAVVATAGKIGAFTPCTFMFHEYYSIDNPDDGTTSWVIILGPDNNEDRYAAFVEAGTYRIRNVIGPLIYPWYLLPDDWYLNFDESPEVYDAVQAALASYMRPDDSRSFCIREILSDDGVLTVTIASTYSASETETIVHPYDSHYAITIDAATYEVIDLVPVAPFGMPSGARWFIPMPTVDLMFIIPFDVPREISESVTLALAHHINIQHLNERPGEPPLSMSINSYEIFLRDDGIWTFILGPADNEDICYTIYVDAITYEVIELIPMTNNREEG
jgi:predicted small secreted protein